MRMLVLGGTAWLGGEIVRSALRRGHDVTCLARGTSGVAPTAARFVAADRNSASAFDPIAGERWDAVIDVARQPGQVRRAVAALEPIAERYLFVSSGNVYADQSVLHADEDAPLLPPLESDVMPDMSRYGEAKVACEQAVLAAFGADRSLLARAGLLGGPGDPFGRSGYWPWRFANPSNPEGRVVVPDALDRSTELLDARDLAEWLVTATERGANGAMNAAGDERTLGEHLDTARRVAGHTGPVLKLPETWLLDQGVDEWMGPRTLPLWLADRDWWGMNARDTSRARAAGLVPRPLEETLADVLAWERARPHPGPHGAGLTDEEERHLLQAWSGRQRDHDG